MESPHPTDSPSHRPPVALFGPSGSASPAGPGLAEAARTVLAAALDPALRDDRFDGAWPPADLMAAVEHDGGGRPIGYLGGTIDRGRLQLDGLLTDRPGGDTAPVRARRLWDALEPAIATSGAESVELWGHPAEPWHDQLAASLGMVEVRALHQLRCSLPLDGGFATVSDRAFVPGQDEDALIRVNNRAFASHPDQGGMTRATIAEAAAQTWFDPEGIRLLDDPDRAGELAGFCWTKIHEPVVEGQPRLGEIYAIGIDPSHHGQGLGVPMTAAGLRWLADQGLSDGMLYVEADNEPALRTYARLGFRQHRTDRAWRRPIER